MTRALGTSKNCATCEYWRGMRGVSSNGRDVDYEQDYELYEEKCTNARSNYRGENTSGSQKCDKWLKWSALECLEIKQMLKTL
jgi:hypothetical protein